jgi:crotonobetainyl-CoA:carnitine CoA-transferase CaiB-like acyl-CoA transferase
MGPLTGIKIVELAGIGPGPMCGVLLADLGARVLRIDRPTPSNLGVERPLEYNLVLRNRETIALDLKAPAAIEVVLDLVESADALIEGFRPGVTERLGLGPDICLTRNPRLVYGRVTGWGQDGPLAKAAGHDLNYIALTGALAAMGRAEGPPAPPLNLVGDFAGGGLYLALGILAGVLEARASGKGQVVDASIVDGTASMMMQFYGMQTAGLWSDQRGSNVLDSGAPFYDVYACADGRYVSVAPIEDKFFVELLDRLGLPPSMIEMKRDRSQWPRLRQVFEETFAQKPLEAWCDLLQGSDACFAPVLNMHEALSHPHLRARETLIEVAGVVQPAPAPRFSRTRTTKPSPPRSADPERDEDILRSWLPADRVAQALEILHRNVQDQPDRRGRRTA